MRGHNLRSAVVGGIIGALVIGVLTPVGAAVGDAIKAGLYNSADATTVLEGDVNAATMRVSNLDADKPALDLRATSGPAIQVNTWDKVPKLSADRVDGMHAYQLMVKSVYDGDENKIVDDADRLDGQAPGFYLDASNLDAGTLSTSRFDAYEDLGDSGRLDNNSDADVLIRSQLDARFLGDGDAYTDLGSSGRLNNDDGADLLTRDQLDARYESQGGESGFPASAADGWYGTVNQGTAQDVVQVPAGIVVTDFFFIQHSFSACKISVRKGTTTISNFFEGGNTSQTIHFDVGIRSENDIVVNLDAGLSGSNCTASVTWTGYSTPSFVTGHDFGTATVSDKWQTTFTEVQIPADKVLGSLGASIPFTTMQGASSTCEIRIRSGADELLRVRHGDTDFEPFVVNLGAGIPSDGDIWIGVRSYVGQGGGAGCLGPIYWTTRTDTTPLVP